jgi:hypothetical protein
MNHLLFRLDQQINSIFDILDEILIMFSVSTFNIFEDVICKFNVFYKVIYEQLDLSSADIEIMLDTTRIQNHTNETRILHQLARCIEVNKQLDIDPESCFKPEQIHDFIRLLNWSCENTIDKMKLYVVSFSNTPQFNILWNFFEHLENLKYILQHFYGEWYDNQIEVGSDPIPPEARSDGEIYFEGEYVDYDYIPPPANMF